MAIGVDPDNADHVWVAFSGYEEDLKVMYSSTGGVGPSAWQNLTGSLPNIPVLSIVTVPGAENGVYLGTDMGVFYRDNSLSDWIYFSNKLPRTQVMDLKIDGNYLYAGTYGRGIWRSGLYSTCPSSITHNSSNDPGDNANTGIRIYSADNMIQSSWIINGGVGTEFMYKAGYSVSLTDGFHAQSFSEFVALIGGCP